MARSDVYPLLPGFQSGNNSWQKSVLVASLGVATVGAALYFGRKFYMDYRASQEERKAMDDTAPASYAKRIQMAFDNDGWPGTNVKALRTVFRQIPSKQVYDQVAVSYEKTTGSPLPKELSDELNIEEYDEMQMIIAGKPLKVGKGIVPNLNYAAWARRIKSAFNFSFALIPFPDKDAIKAVFLDIPTQTAFVETAKAYHKIYGQNVIDELKHQLWGWNEYEDMMRMIIRKPKS